MADYATAVLDVALLIFEGILLGAVTEAALHLGQWILARRHAPS
ncbi:MAG: hypothetical protein ACYDDF_09470 [Thermoplasmatota archaeon]